MNIFNIYLDKIKKIVLEQNKIGNLKIPDNLNSINVDIPPKQFDCDISTNVSMVLSKVNQKPPIDLAYQLIELIKKNDINISSISVATPGFINRVGAELTLRPATLESYALDAINLKSALSKQHKNY